MARNFALFGRPLIRRKALRGALWRGFPSTLRFVENCLALSVSAVRSADVITCFTHCLELTQLARRLLLTLVHWHRRAVQMLMNGGAEKIKAAHDGIESLRRSAFGRVLSTTEVCNRYRRLNPAYVCG